MKPYFVNVYQDERGQWIGGEFRSRRRAVKAARTVSARCVGRLKVWLKPVRINQQVMVTEVAAIDNAVWESLKSVGKFKSQRIEPRPMTLVERALALNSFFL